MAGQAKEKEESLKSKKKSLIEQIESDPIKTLTNIVTITERAMQERVAVWNRYRRKYRRGMFYLRQSDGVPLYFTNYIYSNVETVRANLTKNLPRIAVRAKGDKDGIGADLLGKVLDDALRKAKIKQVTNKVVQHGCIAGVGWFKVMYNPEADKGLGGLELTAVAPEDMLVDPLVTDPDDSRWIGQRIRNVPIENIYARYGKWPDIGVRNTDNSETLLDEGGVFVNRETLQPARDISPTVDLYEIWVRNYETEDEEGNKLPSWYIATFAGQTLLRFEPSVYEHDKHPFVAWFDVTDDNAENIYYKGVGEVEEIEPLQDRADALDMRIYKNISLTANRQRYVSLQSGLNPNMMDNTTGRTYGVNGDPQKAVYYDVPPSLSGDVYNYRDQTEMLIQTVSGIFDVTQGRRPVGITAGRAIESLKDSADTRLSWKVDSLAESLERVGDLSLQIILQFYSGERIIRLTDAGEDTYLRIIDDYPPALQPQPMVLEDGTIIERSIYDLEDNERLTLEQQRTMFKQQNGIDLVLADVTWDWDVECNSDNALPSSRAERGQMAADLFRLGLLDREATLDALDWPDRQKILRRLATEATGKNAGDPMVESGMASKKKRDQLVDILAQFNLPAEMIEQIVSALQGEANNAPEGDTVPPQVAMPTF